MGRLTQVGLIKLILRSSIDQNDPAGYHVFQHIIYSQKTSVLKTSIFNQEGFVSTDFQLFVTI